MPKGKQNKEVDLNTMNQVFDFIFAEAEKEPDKRKPVKVTGMNGSDAFVDALAASMEKPGVFISDQLLESFDEALDFQVYAVKADEIGLGKVKIKSGSIIDILKDPSGYWDKAFKTSQAIQKSMKAQYMGKSVQRFYAHAWASRMDLDIDVQKAIEGSFKARRLDRHEDLRSQEESYTQTWATATVGGGRFRQRGDKSAMLASETAHVSKRSQELKMREEFKRDWDRFSVQQKDMLKKYYFRGEDDNNTDIDRQRIQRVLAQVGVSLPEDPDRPPGIAAFKYKESLKQLADLKEYTRLEIGNVNKKIEDLQSLDLVPGSIEDLNRNRAIDNLEKAQVLIRGQVLDKASLAEARTTLEGQIRRYKQMLRDPDIAGDRDKKRAVQESIRTLNQDVRNFNMLIAAGTVGQIEGFYSSYKSYFKDGNLVKSILTGDFFDENKNKLLNPSTKGEFYFHKDPRDNNFGKVEIYVPYHAEGQSNLVKAYNEVGTNLYYLTPRSMMRTLFVNGEGFVYATYRQERKIQEFLKKALPGNDTLPKLELDKIIHDPDYIRSYLADIPNLTEEQRKKLEKYLGNLSRVAKVANVLSWQARLRDSIGGLLDKAVFSKMREKIGNGLLKSRLFNSLNVDDIALFKTWMEKGGIQVFAQSVSTAILKSLGVVVTGGFSEILVGALADKIVDVSYKAGKTIFVTITWALMGMVAVIIMFWSWGHRNVTKNMTYPKVTPGNVIACENYTASSKVLKFKTGDVGVVYDGDIQEIYAQVQQELGIGTGLELVNCPNDPPLPTDHYACAKIDWAWCYSGSAVYCKADALAPQSAETLTKLFRHELLHQVQATGGGGANSTFREWGADYLSDNGGGYHFKVSGGEIIRATEVGARLISDGVCSHNELAAIARNESGSLSTACGVVLQNTIKEKIHY